MSRMACIFALVATSLVPAMLHAQLTVSVEPWDITVNVGDTFEMEYWVGNLGNSTAPSLGAFDLTMDFDPALVSYDSTTIGPMLGDVNAAQAVVTITPLADGVNVVETSLLTPAELDALQPWSFVVFRVRFVAQAVGDAVFEPGVTSLSDAFGRPLGLELGALAIVHIQEARAIPTLSAWGMWALTLAMLLAGLAVLRRKL